MATKQLLVFSNPTDGKDSEYNDWYDGQHLPDVLAVPGFVGAQRFRIGAPDANLPGSNWSYLAIYEIEESSFDAAWLELQARSASGVVRPSDAINLATTSVVLASPLGPRVTG